MMIGFDWIIDIILSPEVFIPLVFPGLLTVTLTLLGIIWLERKLTAKVQLRYGPLYVTRRLGGILQLLADGIKFLFSEQIIPRTVDKLAFLLGPLLLFTFSILPIIGIPLSASYAAITSDLSLLIVVALLVIGPIFFLMISWASNNKFSSIGGLREGYLIISYEIPIIISILAMAVLYHSLDLIEIAESQSGVWGILVNPLAALVFLIAALIATGGFPYEIGEAESEIVAGYGSEYGSILYATIMGAGYLRQYVMSLLFTIVFLGGWNPVPGFIPNSGIFPGVLIFLKSLLVMGLLVFFRSVYPRYRVDQAVRIGWQKLFVLSMVSIGFPIILVTIGIGGVIP
ncbi:NADH dehydrogenase [candidate division MSBL1 archaeon SCGC-AAA261O19]|uniref:NADH dehydrogenase n=1 Tax=candidate division MSBL1 archaeon SCGC-AAA261O19 TaxID=1698277 RepID=A0A133VEM4_9EURY|nr:NADH dehydrogenase [candidate division MSBL1 archaeon SCGC-AAA261O19]